MVVLFCDKQDTRASASPPVSVRRKSSSVPGRTICCLLDRSLSVPLSLSLPPSLCLSVSVFFFLCVCANCYRKIFIYIYSNQLLFLVLMEVCV